MHESSLIPSLLEKIEALGREHHATMVVAVDVSIGELSGIGAEHFKEHFIAETAGTIADGAELRVRVNEDPFTAGSHSVLLESVELET